MLAFNADSSAGHEPKQYYRRGKLIAPSEIPARFHLLRESVAGAGHELSTPSDHGLAPLSAVHTQRYLNFLATAWARRSEVDANAEELLTTQFAKPQMHRLSGRLANELGYFTADTSTPIRQDTWAAIYGSGQCAVSAADAALELGVAYALCRPPGHHAFAESAGGFCFLNNTAIAAQRLCEATGGRVAVIDIDVHHGNGTQGIFYERSDVFTVSVHADPSDYFPLYAGYADEVGIGAGVGFNLNLPLPHRAGDEAILAALAIALDRVRAFRPAAIVVALGLDAAAEDPLGVFEVTGAGFSAMAASISRLRLPSALIQEGGYLCPSLGENLVAFLDAFEGASR